ncbi:Uma2 family endonuclease [Gloeocapsopsis dulcis]|nr:Uma2 family endonuclease [Gloeocapsopsis dulcis]WNN92024.1 Uma2 family endonuclease [Gloeocapsopsis dulcis]
MADTTWEKDRTVKARVYANAKIPEYWILDVDQRQLYVLREPGSEKYQQELIVNEDQTLSMLAFPDIEIHIHQLFP